MCEALGLSWLRQLTWLTYGHTPQPCLHAVGTDVTVCVMWGSMAYFLIISLTLIKKQTHYTTLMWVCALAERRDAGSMADPCFVCAGLCHASHTGPGVNGGLWTKPNPHCKEALQAFNWFDGYWIHILDLRTRAGPAREQLPSPVEVLNMCLCCRASLSQPLCLFLPLSRIVSSFSWAIQNIS